jgi:hypothetical protein
MKVHSVLTSIIGVYGVYRFWDTNQDLTSAERKFYLDDFLLYHPMNLPHRNHRFVIRQASVWLVTGCHPGLFMLLMMFANLADLRDMQVRYCSGTV